MCFWGCLSRLEEHVGVYVWLTAADYAAGNNKAALSSTCHGQTVPLQLDDEATDSSFRESVRGLILLKSPRVTLTRSALQVAFSPACQRSSAVEDLVSDEPVASDSTSDCISVFLSLLLLLLPLCPPLFIWVPPSSRLPSTSVKMPRWSFVFSDLSV